MGKCDFNTEKLPKVKQILPKLPSTAKLVMCLCVLKCIKGPIQKTFNNSKQIYKHVQSKKNDN